MALYGDFGNKHFNVNKMKYEFQFVKLKNRFFMRHAIFYRTKIRVGNTEKFAFLTPWQAHGTQEDVLTNQI